MNSIGINLSGSEYSWGSFPDNSELDLLQREGIDLVRLPIAWERMQPTLNGPLDANYLNGLETFLSEAAAHNIKVVVDLHNYGRYDTGYAQDSLELYSSGAVSTPITLPTSASYSLKVTAKGSSAAGVWPSMQVSVDGHVVGTASVSSTSLGEYDFSVNEPAGAHTISIAYTNDAVVNGQDRNLYVSQLHVTGPGSFAADLSALSMPDRPASSSVEIDTGPGNGDAIGTAGVPVSAFADFWTKFAGALHGNPGVAGYDIMNEPHNMPSAATWPAAAQAAVNAIRTVDSGTTIFVEGDGWANAKNWLRNNANLHIVDPSNNLVYEAHAYFDDGSGTYTQTYDQEGAYPTIGVDDITPFLQWLQQNGYKGFLGEFGVPNNDPRWLTVLQNVVQTLKADGVPGTYWNWTYHSPTDPSWWPDVDPLSAIAADGSIQPQMGVLFASEAPIIASYSEGAGTAQSGASNQLTLVGTAVPDCTVQIFDGAKLLGSATAAADGSWSFVVPASTVSMVLVSMSTRTAEVVHSFTADMVDHSGDVSGLSKPIEVIDTLNGGTGHRIYLFDVPPNIHTKVPHISHFSQGDEIALNEHVFVNRLSSRLVPITINSHSFYKAPGATHAHTAAQHIIYNTTTGGLYYDSDGNGPRPGVEFAVLNHHPHLTFHDFLMVA